ncbi:peptidoglycan DD-metalloendopeptidase family protein [Algibacter miyuki]|uniref:Peptidoglycan DD-metalloendopeptidase family protein n=1 Tax=Algibacter miyuki TaxID=1306933 RepID=A0ABV5H1P8_9FLAO|nr:peptidoglycan DD-metalloendopeptidase family protein [Algibacter miyuki]MDN3666436.1 peptidoglycan DD-metalloendopeptidase family protein [Algibacter miyuki]
MDFSKFLSGLHPDGVSVLDSGIPKSKYIPIDLSETNDFLNTVDVSSSSKLGGFVDNHINKQHAEVAYGGYLEIRNIYKRSTHFNSQAEEERNIHLGVDLWCPAGTPIFSPFDSVVHSFNNNENFGDYGPTIILKHHISGIDFYTLYGHLSLASLNNLEVGQRFKQADKIAELGDASVNGDYPPHLHFQIIKDIQDFNGDYPGVCSKANLEFYKNNCPDPEVLLKLSLK